MWDPEQRVRIGFALLVPGAFVFALRALIEATGGVPGDVPGLTIVTILGGVLSLAGLALLVWASWRTPDRIKAITVAAVILIGHYAVSPHYPDLGAAMVYLGTGFAAALRMRWGAYAGLLAGAGAILRSADLDPRIAFAMIAAGSAASGVLFVLAAAGRRDVEALDTKRRRT